MRVTYRALNQNGESTGDVFYNAMSIKMGDNIFPQTDKEKMALKKLAAYEDTGLTPEEFHESVAFVLELNKKLKPYMDAKEQGLLVRLPCKVGDTVFLAQVGREEPFSMRVQGISISASGNDVILHFGGFPITNAWGSEVGKTLYLTREEAEAALKGETQDV